MYRFVRGALARPLEHTPHTHMHPRDIHATCVYAGLYFSAQTVVEGTSNVGEFVSVNTYMMNLFTPLYFLGTVYNIIIQVRRSGGRAIHGLAPVWCKPPETGRA